MESAVKKSFVVKAIFEKEVSLSKGIFYQHNIEMQNGDKGQYLSKEKVQKKFVEGQEAEYTYEETTIKTKSGDDFVVKKIRPKQQNPMKSQGSYYDRPEVIRDITNAQMFHEAMYFAVAHKDKKLTLDNIKSLQAKFIEYCFQDTGQNAPDSKKVMNRRTSIKLAVEYLQVDIVSSSVLLDNAEYIYKLIRG